MTGRRLALTTEACDEGVHDRCMKSWCRCDCHDLDRMVDDIVNGQRLVTIGGRRHVKVDLFSRPRRHGTYRDPFRWWKPSHLWAAVQHRRWMRRYW